MMVIVEDETEERERRAIDVPMWAILLGIEERIPVINPEMIKYGFK